MAISNSMKIFCPPHKLIFYLDTVQHWNIPYPRGGPRFCHRGLYKNVIILSLIALKCHCYTRAKHLANQELDTHWFTQRWLPVARIFPNKVSRKASKRTHLIWAPLNEVHAESLHNFIKRCKVWIIFHEKLLKWANHWMDNAVIYVDSRPLNFLEIALQCENDEMDEPIEGANILNTLQQLC